VDPGRSWRAHRSDGVLLSNGSDVEPGQSSKSAGGDHAERESTLPQPHGGANRTVRDPFGCLGGVELLVDRAYGLLAVVLADDERDVQLARALRDRHDIHLRAPERAEHARSDA